MWNPPVGVDAIAVSMGGAVGRLKLGATKSSSGPRKFRRKPSVRASLANESWSESRANEPEPVRLTPADGAGEVNRCRVLGVAPKIPPNTELVVLSDVIAIYAMLSG